VFQFNKAPSNEWAHGLRALTRHVHEVRRNIVYWYHWDHYGLREGIMHDCMGGYHAWAGRDVKCDRIIILQPGYTGTGKYHGLKACRPSLLWFQRIYGTMKTNTCRCRGLRPPWKPTHQITQDMHGFKIQFKTDIAGMASVIIGTPSDVRGDRFNLAILRMKR